MTRAKGKKQQQSHRRTPNKIVKCAECRVNIEVPRGTPETEFMCNQCMAGLNGQPIPPGEPRWYVIDLAAKRDGNCRKAVKP